MPRLIAALIALVTVFPPAASAQTASRVIRLIDQRCANCHRTATAGRPPDVQGAPEMATLRRMAPETILQAITSGAMRVHAEDVTDEVKRAVAEYLSGRKLTTCCSHSRHENNSQLWKLGHLGVGSSYGCGPGPTSSSSPQLGTRSSGSKTARASRTNQSSLMVPIIGGRAWRNRLAIRVAPR